MRWTLAPLMLFFMVRAACGQDVDALPDLSVMPDLPEIAEMPPMDDVPIAADDMAMTAADDMMPMDMPEIDMPSVDAPQMPEAPAPVADNAPLPPVDAFPDIAEAPLSVPDNAVIPTPVSQGAVYDMSNPFAPPPPELIKPMNVPSIHNNDMGNTAVDQSQMEFFQPGVHVQPQNTTPVVPDATVVVDEAEISPKSVTHRVPKRVIRFNYKNQQLKES